MIMKGKKAWLRTTEVLFAAILFFIFIAYISKMEVPEYRDLILTYYAKDILMMMNREGYLVGYVNNTYNATDLKNYTESLLPYGIGFKLSILNATNADGNFTLVANKSVPLIGTFRKVSAYALFVANESGTLMPYLAKLELWHVGG